MSLNALTAQAVETAFTVAGDAVAAVVWRKIESGDYDVENGVQGGREKTQAVRAVVGEFSAAEIAKAGLSAKAVRLYIPAVDFKQGDPVHDDKFTHDGILFTAKRAVWEGVKVLWEIWGDV
jgi:hypothetical protein